MSTATIKDFTILFRAVGVTVRATSMLYVAAEMLRPGKNMTDREVNKSICQMVANLLSLPSADLSMVERVLRSLPDNPDTEGG